MAHQVLVPPLGQTTDTVVLSAWYKQVGDTVKEGEPLFAIETDKATLDIEAQASGILVESNASVGDSVVVLSTIGVIAAPGERGRRGEEKRGGGEAGSSERDVVPRTIEGQTATGAARGQRTSGEQGRRVFISPRARHLAEAESITWQGITGTGPEGAIVERDIRQYLTRFESQKQQVEGVREAREETSKAGAQEPKATPISHPTPAADQGWLATDVDASAIVMLQDHFKRRDLDISLDSIMLYILARTLAQQPVGDEAVSDISIGVAMVAARKFARPALHDLQSKHLSQISRELANLSARAQSGSLAPDDLKGAQIAYVNLAAFGIDTYAPPLDPEGIPVLGVGRIKRGASGREMMWLSLSFGASGLDPLAAVRLIQAVAQLIEDPDLLF